MRKDKPGRPPKIADIKARVIELRAKDLSFAEIGKLLGVSRQLAQWHFSTVSMQGIDKET